jgi:hypothetical protein
MKKSETIKHLIKKTDTYSSNGQISQQQASQTNKID